MCAISLLCSKTCWCSCFFPPPFSTKPCLIQQMGWLECREWPAVHFFFISSYVHHPLYDLYLTYHTSSKLCTELWINICFLSLILRPCNLWLSQKAGKLSSLSLHLPYEKKKKKQPLFWSLLYAWGARHKEAWQESQEETVSRPELQRRNRKYFSYFMKRQKCFHCLTEIFLALSQS